MVSVSGPKPEQVEGDAVDLAHQMVRGMRRVVHATTDVPDLTDLPEVRTAIYRAWSREVDRTVRPHLVATWRRAADRLQEELQRIANSQVTAASEPVPGAFPVSPVAEALAVEYLATRDNYLVGIADELWFLIRKSLIEGMQAGEAVQVLRERVRDVVEVAKPRANAIARTEVIGASNHGSFAQVRETGLRMRKTWLATPDSRTRPDHAAADGQTRDLGEPFLVGGYQMDHPHAEGAPASEIVNCRCVTTYELDESELAPVARAASGGPVAILTEDTPTTGGEVMPWHTVNEHPECPDGKPWAVVANDTGELMGCHTSKEEADAQVAALYAAEPDAAGVTEDFAGKKKRKTMPPADMPAGWADFTESGQWEGVLAVEGSTTGDGREFAPESLTWGELPIPLRWNVEDSHGGNPHTVAVLVGRIDEIWRDGANIMGRGGFDTTGQNGAEAFRLVQEEFLKGVSVDVDNISDADVEMVFPDAADGESGADLMTPEKMLFHAGRIRAATLVDIPAFVEAYISIVDSGDVAASADRVVLEMQEAVAAAGVPVMDDAPPAEWFRNPELSLPSPIIITEDGRVYGHAARWGECHVGYQDVCVSPPEEEEHPFYMTGEMLCADGSRVAVGQITVGTGHAPLGMSSARAAEHYDDTGSAVADVAVGNDTHGIWVAGAVRSDADPARVRDLRAAGQVSGDWRRIGGQLRLVGLLAVNIPGFPVPKLAARVASGAQMALVAAGKPVAVRATETDDELNARMLRRMMDRLRQRVLGDTDTEGR